MLNPYGVMAYMFGKEKEIGQEDAKSANYAMIVIVIAVIVLIMIFYFNNTDGFQANIRSFADRASERYMPYRLKLNK